MRESMRVLDEWITEIERQAGFASSPTILDYHLKLHVGAMQRYFLRIQDIEDVDAYRRHIDVYRELLQKREARL